MYSRQNPAGTVVPVASSVVAGVGVVAVAGTGASSVALAVVRPLLVLQVL